MAHERTDKDSPLADIYGIFSWAPTSIASDGWHSRALALGRPVAGTDESPTVEAKSLDRSIENRRVARS